MLKKITESGLRATLKRFWFQTDTGEFTWRGRATILAIAFILGSVVALILGSMITSYLPELLDQLLPADEKNKYLQAMAGAWARLAVTAVATVSSILIFLGLWVIRTHDKKIEFKNHREQMTRHERDKKDEYKKHREQMTRHAQDRKDDSKKYQEQTARHEQDKKDDSKRHQEQLNRSQIEKAVDRLAGRDPIYRGLGLSRLTHLYREERMSEDEYLGYTAICRSWVSSVNIHNAGIPMIAISTNLREAILVFAHLAKAHLIGARLTGAVLTHAELTEAYMDKANLTKAKLASATLIKAKLAGALLTGAKLAKADLTDANLTGANLTDAYLTDADIVRAGIGIAHLQQRVAIKPIDGDLADAYLVETRKETILAGTKRIKADLSDANLTRANLVGANLTGANLTGAILEGSQVDRCTMTADAKQLFANQKVDVSGVIVVDDPSSTVKTQSPPQ